MKNASIENRCPHESFEVKENLSNGWFYGECACGEKTFQKEQKAAVTQAEFPTPYSDRELLEMRVEVPEPPDQSGAFMTAREGAEFEDGWDAGYRAGYLAAKALFEAGK